MDVHYRAIQSVSPKQAKAFFSHCQVSLIIDDWLGEQASRKAEEDILPQPFNDLFEVFWDLL
jgi:hypothetical protein